MRKPARIRRCRPVMTIESAAEYGSTAYCNLLGSLRVGIYYMLLIGRTCRQPLAPRAHVGMRGQRCLGRPVKPPMRQRSSRNIRHSEFVAAQVLLAGKMPLEDVHPLHLGLGRGQDGVGLSLGCRPKIILQIDAVKAREIERAPVHPFLRVGPAARRVWA